MMGETVEYVSTVLEAKRRQEWKQTLGVVVRCYISLPFPYLTRISFFSFLVSVLCLVDSHKRRGCYSVTRAQTSVVSGTC